MLDLISEKEVLEAVRAMKKCGKAKWSVENVKGCKHRVAERSILLSVIRGQNARTVEEEFCGTYIYIYMYGQIRHTRI